MALKTRISKDAFQEMPEALQEYYKESGDSYVLDVDGIDDHPTVQGLKRKNDELMGETKAERERRKQLELEQEERDREAAEQQGQYQKLYQTEREKAEKLQGELDARERKIQEGSIAASAGKIAQGLAAKDVKRAAVLTDYAKRHAKYVDGEVVFEIGGIRVDEAKLSEHLANEYPFLVDGSQASGGGAPGNNGGRAAAVNPWKSDSFNLTKQAEILRESPETAARLKGEAGVR